MRTSAIRSKKRFPAGSVMAELPLVLWVFLLVVAFPLLDLSAAFLRLTFGYAAVQQASVAAARANTFKVAVDGKPSAVQEAQSKINQVQKSFSGVAMQNVATSIVVTNNLTLVQSSQVAPLAVPADQSVNSYMIEVGADCSADPFLPIPSPVSIAGLNAPLTVHFNARQYCENPSGLNL